MTQNNNPGIFIEQIVLIRSVVELLNPQGKPEYDLRLTRVGREFANDNKNLAMTFSFSLMGEIKDPLFNLLCDFGVFYKRVDDATLTWDEFSDATALAHVIPYLREFISNMTNRLPVQPLILPPINTNIMISEYLKTLPPAKD
ncbi:protein-export chaperone SecB [Myxococcota bacterium]|nr:protein-export chaperone SecB [Myxococcota bacterium]